MIQKSANVMDEERVEKLRYFLAIRKVEGTVKWNPNHYKQSPDAEGEVPLPDTLEMHGANFDYVASFFAFQDSVSSASGHAGYI